MKVLFITNVPSPYRVDFFNELGKLCELTVCYERKSAGDRDTRWRGNNAINYTAHFTKAKHVGADKTIGFDLIKEIKCVSFDRLIIAGYASPSVMLAIAYCRLHRIPYILESDGGFYQVDHGYKKVLKRFLLCGAKAHFTTGEEYIMYLESLGISKDKIHKYPFTSLYDKDIASVPATEKEKKVLREELGIIETKVILSVGQFIHRKGFDLLMKAAKSFEGDVGTYIVGGTPGETYIELKNNLGLENVHFVDFMQKDELIKWYRAADLFVLPTREDIWGLVINEAMAQGLPIITTKKCIAGLELVDEENGKLVNVDSAEEISESVKMILNNDSLKNKMATGSIEKINKYTFENMARVHFKFLSEIRGN